MLSRLSVKRFIAMCLSVSMIFISVQPVVNAAIVTTSDIITEQQSYIDREYLLTQLDRKEVQAALVNRGVDLAMAKERVASMTDQEVVALNLQMDEMPAGSGVLGALVLIFLVLLFTDIMGWTDVYPFVK